MKHLHSSDRLKVLENLMGSTAGTAGSCVYSRDDAAGILEGQLWDGKGGRQVQLE